MLTLQKEKIANNEQSKIIKFGKQVHSSVEKFHKAVRKFRTSGLWACTSEHHKTFKSWCKFAAPKMHLAVATLDAYGCENYIMNKSRMQQKSIGSFWVYGEAATKLRKAVKHAISLGLTGKVRRGTRRQNLRIAVSVVSDFFLDNANATFKKNKKYHPPFDVFPIKRIYNRRKIA